MTKKFKGLILFGIFILILFISTLTKQFSSEILWAQKTDSNPSFQGLLFKNPEGVNDFIISRSIEKFNGENIVRFDVEFSYQGEESSLRILGEPNRHVFFSRNVGMPSHSEVDLKGDYDKINEKLFTEKLSLKDLYKKTSNYEYVAKSSIKVPLKSSEDTYSITLYYDPNRLMYSGDDVLTETTAFITNGKVTKFISAEDMGENENPSFTEQGFYVNAQEIKNDNNLSKLSLGNNLNNLIFVISTIALAVLLWFDKKNLSILYLPLLYLILLTFYRFLGMGATTLGILIIMPILAYIGAVISKLMIKEDVVYTLNKKELKQCLLFAILFLIFVLIVLVVPRAL